MKARPFRRHGYWVLITSVVLLLIGITMLPQVSRAGHSPSPEEVVQRAWRLAQESGAYHFATEIVQTRYPAPTLVNVGRSSHKDTLYIEGQADLPERTLLMTLWKDGGNVLTARDGVQVRVEGDQAYGRQIGGTWQEVGDFSGAFAPGSDLMAYLVGAVNVQQVGESADQRIGSAHYAFDVNGPAFAEYLRAQMEDYLRTKGELPAGLTLDSSDTYRATTGQGEVWIDDRGLPARIRVHLAYPRQSNGEQIEADIQTDFSNFALLDVTENQAFPHRLVSALGLPRTMREWQQAGQHGALATAVLGVMSVLLVYRRSKKLYTTFVMVILLSMVMGPVLQSHHVYAFSRRIVDRQIEQEQRQEEAQAAGDLQYELLASDWNPRRDPLGSANQSSGESVNRPIGPVYRSTGLPTYQLAAEESPDPESDEDGDGLIYAYEARLGTADDNLDSDGDLIRDDVEVEGFEWPVGSGRRWYSDPNNPDTNNDGQTDTHECWTSFPPSGAPPYTARCDKDTDNDGTPDLFDTDNDDDGVPDRADLSPTKRMRTADVPFEQNRPFQLVVDGLERGNPVFVDFQLRPQEDNHLTYALNVLDWPSGDHDGQVQRHKDNDATFEDVAVAQGKGASPGDANGDMRLVPMLEITIPYDGGYGNLPVKSGAPATRLKNAALDTWLDRSKLEPYGISVRKKDNDGDLLVYVPLNVVSDETGGGRVAFSARMLYWPKTNSWGEAQEVRVVWLVLMLTDACRPAPLGTGEEEAETWCDDPANWDWNVQQPVHTYEEAWYLTGLAVREDRGLDVAVVLEDPDDDEDTQYDDNLWLLANGLENVFVSGRDANDNDKRDIAITAQRGDSTISSRFDVDEIAAGTTITDRWGIPLTATMQVATYSYPHQDYIAHIMMTETVNVLNDYFVSPTGEPQADAPTLLFAREERYRSANLDNQTQPLGDLLTIQADLANAPVTTMALLSWAPYRYRDDKWQSYPITEYWDLMEVRFKELFPPGDPNDPDSIYIAIGQVALAKSYYLSMYNGVTGMVWIGANRVWQFDQEQLDASLTDIVKPGRTSRGIGGIASAVAEKFFTYMDEWLPVAAKIGVSSRADLCFMYVGMRIQGVLQDIEAAFKLSAIKAKLSGVSGKVKAGLAIVGAIVAVGVTVALAAQGKTFMQVASIVLGIVGVVVAIKSVVEHGKRFVENLVRLSMGLKLVDSMTKAQLKAGIIGVIVSAVVTFAAFVAMWIVSGVRFGSLAFNAMLAGAIANVVVAVIMLAIAMIPVVGQIIAAIIGLIDSVIVTLCTAFGWEEGKVGKWVCKGISGLMAEAIKWAIYSNTIMVDMDADDRLDVQNFQQDVFDPGKGMAVGNALAMGATITTTIGLVDIPIDWKAAAFWWQYSQKTLKSATFEYALQATDIDIHDDLSRGDVTDWTSTADKKVFIVRNVATDGSGVSLDEAGINRTVGLYLSEGHAIPAQECWAVPSYMLPPCPTWPCIPVCYIRTEKATNQMNLGQNFKYDVFPETLDGFYMPVEKNGGYSLAWGQDTAITSTVLGGAALTFPRQQDFDGDGLLNSADGGSDPDDSRWDTDGDGLSDYFESQIGSNATLFDTDGDGLNDREEARLETDPNRQDTDGDGLTDREEVAGWEFIYAFDADDNPVSTWVTSDPLEVDGDGDALTDFKEKVFGFNPRAFSDPTILNFESQVREANAPSLLLRFEEVPGAAAFADSSGHGNAATCEGGGCPTLGVDGRHGYAAQFDGTDDLIVVPDSPELDMTTFSVGAWVWPTQVRTSYQSIITKQDDAGTQQNYGLFIEPNSRRIYVSFYTGNCLTWISFWSTGSLPLNQWTHVMLTYNGSRFRLYLNGEVDQSVSHSAAVCQNDEPIKIGGERARSTPFSGRIDEVAIFGRALSQAEVQTLMAGRYNPDDLFVQPGATLDYQATVKNELLARYAQGLLSTEFPGLLSGDVPPEPFVLQPRDEMVMAGSVEVITPLLTSAQADLTQVAGALITDWREQSDFAEMWLRLDEASGATAFSDYSGAMPPRSGSCTDATTCPRAGETGAFGYAPWFDGNNDRVVLPDADKLKLRDTSFTVSAWIQGSSFSGGDKTALGTDGQTTNRGLFLGVSNSRPYMSFYNNSLSSNYTLATNTWYHVVFRYDKTNLEMAIFVNGEMKASDQGHTAFQGTGTAYLGRAQSGKYFNGWIDDVRVFERALTQVEIRALYTQPILRLAFEEPTGAIGFVDGSGFGSHGVCNPVLNACPGRARGVNGQAAQFGGDDYISVGPNAPLNMSEGKFTLSTWVYPTNSGTSSVDNYVQGILGRYSSHIDTNDVNGDTAAYPTLLRVGRKLRFGFGTGSAWVWNTTTQDVLTLNAWNHVVTTFGPTYDTNNNFTGNVATLYVNGEVVGNWNMGSARPTASARQFFVGRATDRARLYLDRIYVDDEGDGAGDAELYINWMGSEIWRDDDSDQGETLYIQQNQDYTDLGLLQVWEDDWVGDGEVGADDKLIERLFSTNEVGNSSITSLYGEGGAGPTKVTLYFSYPNSSIPFRGRIDETVFYKRALNEAEVGELYLAGASGLHLRFDDAPGSASFENATGSNTGVCTYSRDESSDACPTVGVAGRLNQAALFDGANDYVEAELDVSETSYAASLWFKTEGGCADCGIFSVDKGTQGSQGNDRHVYLSNGNLCARIYSNETICTTGQNYADDEWHHVAHTFGSPSATDTRLLMHLEDGQAGSAAFTYQVYNNRDLSGTPIETGPTNWPLDFDWSDNSNFRDISIRWTGDFYFQEGTYSFIARSDDGVRVYVDNVLIISDWTTHSARDYSVPWYMADGKHTIKVEYFQGGGDAELEFRWSPFYRDSSGSGFHGNCSGSACPRSVAGKFGRALEFDGSDDWATVTDFDIADNFTISLWVNPDSTADGQAFISKHDAAGDNLIVFGFYNGGYEFNLRGQIYRGGTKTTGWQHLVIVGDENDTWTQVTVYKDGRQVWQQWLEAAVGNIFSLRPWSIGQEWDGNTLSDFFDGKIDEIAIYNRALTLKEVEELYANHRLYVDGELMAAGVKAASDFTSQTGVNVGFSNDALEDYFAGRIDDVRILHQALGSPEVQVLFKAAPQFQMRMDESVPTCAFRTEYYTNTLLSGKPAISGCDSWPLNHDWGSGGPDEADSSIVGADNFSARWTGDFYFDGGTYTFVARTSDGVRVWVDGVNVVDQWSNTATNEYQVNRTLGQGVHNVKVEYRELAGNALIQLHWKPFFMDASGNDNHGACGNAAACPAVGASGQVGLAAEFDGIDDLVSVPDAAPLDFYHIYGAPFSVGAWVKPTQVKSTYQTIVAKANSTGGDRNYVLSIAPNSMQVEFGFDYRPSSSQDCMYSKTGLSAASLVRDQWNHVMMTHEGQPINQIKLYINGYLDKVVDTGAINYMCENQEPFKIGGDSASSGSLAGRVDEVTIYGRVLSAREVRDVFLYQGKWVEERQSHAVTIDADAPTSALRSVRTDEPDYRANRDEGMHIETGDPTSGVALAELGVMKDGQSGYTWFSAPRCMDSVSDVAWCIIFDPTKLGGEGRYNLRTRTTDLVGNREAPAQTHTVYVDATPPQVSTLLSDGARRDAVRHPNMQGAWLVSLSGTVSDPLLSSGDPGSGVAADTVRVTLYGLDGAPAGMGTQAATVTGNTWAVDYIFVEAEPTGVYIVSVEAEDHVGNRRVVDDLVTIHVDATAPAAHLNLSSVPTAAITASMSFQGDVTEQPVPLAVTWTTDDGGGDEVGLTIACRGMTLYALEPGSFVTSTATYNWEGLAHRSAACQVSVTDSAGNGGTTGAVRVCGEQVASWDGSYASSRSVSFTADAAACGPVLATGGVSKTEVAFTPAQPGSAFYNQSPPQGQVLHLPFEDSTDENGTLRFLDVSGRNHHGVCTGASCPIVGQAGRSGNAALFDGVDDAVTVADPADHVFFTVSAWVYRTGANTGRETIVDFGCGVVLSLNEDRWGHWEKQYPSIQAYYDAFLVQQQAVPLNTWVHLAATRGRDNYLRLYRDGRQVASQYITWVSTNCDHPTVVGSDRSQTGRFFPGLVDDVRVFDRGLSADEIKSLYYDSAPALALSFEAAWAVDGVLLGSTPADQHHVTLYTGVDDGSNKSAAGRVGAYALKFDGVDDYAAVAPHASLNLGNGRFTLAAWVNPTPQHAGRYPILDSGAYHVPGYRYPFLHVINRTQLQVGFGDGSDLDTFTTGGVLTENAWNHIVATFDGTTYRVYVNGVERASTTQFAGSTPHATQRLDVGRGTETGGTYACAQIPRLTFTPNSWSLYGYRIKFNGARIWGGRVATGQTVSVVNQPLDFCGSSEIAVDRNYLGVWQPMGTHSISATPGTGNHTFIGAGKSATVSWDVIQDPSQLLYFRGQLDDVRIYPRTLSAVEIEAFYNSAWRAATLDQSGSGVSISNWTAQVPTGLEGSYRIDLRGWDVAGHFNHAVQEQGVWRGEIDTAPPRVSLTRETIGASYRYTTVAQDLNLTEEGFRSPCGAGVVTRYEYLYDPVYMALAGQTPAGSQKLNQLTAVCTRDATPQRDVVGTYNTPGLAYDVAVSGTYAYVADSAGGLRVVDISDPIHPRSVAVHDTPGGAANGIALAQLSALRIAQPDNRPQQSGTQRVPGDAFPVAHLGDPPNAAETSRPSTQAATADVRSIARSQNMLTGTADEDDFSDADVGLLGSERSPAGVFLPTSLRSDDDSAPLLSPAAPTQSEDLMVESVVVTPTVLGLRQPFTVSVTVRNQSTTSMGVDFWTGVYADYVPTGCDCCTHSWDCINHGPLGAGVTATLAFTHPGFIRAGNHAIYAQTDSYCVLYDDPDPNNNTYGPVIATVPSFTVTATSPAGNGLSILRGGLISATFSRIVSSSTVTTRTFAVRGNQTGIYTQSYAIVDNTVTFNAQPDYKPGEEVVVSLSDGVRSIDASWLIPYTWQFRAAVSGGTGIFSDSGRALGSTWPIYHIALADLDGDGDLDTFMDMGADVEIWLNDGSGVFTDTGQRLSNPDLEDVALGDLDGDGDLDAFVGNSGFLEPPNEVWLNDGTGVFTDSGQNLGNGNTWSLALGDVDGDGDLDTLVGNVGFTQIWLNDGTGVFTDSGQNLGSAETFDADLGDLDGDGDLDAFVDVRVWLNDGEGLFTDSGQTLSSVIPYASALADLDEDGDLDIIYADNIGDNYIWINDGGVFTNTDLFPTGAYHIALGDVDWDEDLDLLAGDQLWLNNGTGAFTYTRSLGISDTEIATLGDMDADGDLDAICSGPDGGTGIMLNNPHTPTANDDSFAVPPDSSANILNVLANDSDADGDEFAILAVGAPDQGGTAALSGTAHISYTPATSFFGLEVFTYTISDAGGAIDTATVTITVGGANDPPTTQDDTAATDEDTPVTVAVLANDSDPNGQTVILQSAGTPAHGSAVVAGQSVVYTPQPDFNGSDSFTYVATDGWLTNTATVTVTVTPVNDRPEFTAGTDQVVPEDSGTHTIANWASSIRPGPVTAVDEVGQVLTFTLSNDNTALFAIQPELDMAGTLTFASAADANGTAVVTVTLRDSGGTANGGVDNSSQVLAITVTAVNDRPVAGNVSRATPEDVPLSIPASALASDVDGDILTVVAVGTPVSGTAVAAGSTLIYTPALELSYVTAFTCAVGDPSGLTDTARITVTVSPVNDLPTLDPLSDRIVDEDAPAQTVSLSGITSGAFNENQILSVTATSLNTVLIPHPTVVYASPAATGTLRFTPAADRFGGGTINVQVSDGVSTTTRSFQVTVNPVNDPPTLNPLPDMEIYADAGLQTVNLSGITAGPNETQALAVTARSSDVALIPHPTVSYFSPNTTGSLGFTPIAGRSGVATIAVTVTDGLSETVRAFQIAVHPPPTLLACVAADDAGLLVIDVTTPHHPWLAGSYNTPGFARDVAVSGSYAYVADWHRGLRVVDISDPTAPQSVGSYDTPGYAVDVAISGDYAYVADFDRGLQIIDISKPASPQWIGGYTPPSVSVMGVTISGTYAYLATHAYGLLVVDVANPASPHLEGYVGLWWGWDVVVSGDYAFLTGGTDGLRVIDVANPANPQFAARADTSGFARGIAVSGNYAYVADDGQGLQVVSLDEPLPPQATACDMFGHCTTVGVTHQASRVLQYADPGPLSVSILSVPSVLDSADPISVTGEAYAITSTLHALTVTVDGALLYTSTWTSGAVTRTAWSTDWTPGNEGAHVIQALVTDWDRAVASDTVTVTVDVQPPTISIAPTVLTGTHYHLPRTLDLTGSVSDTASEPSVRIAIGQDGVWSYDVGVQSYGSAPLITGTWRMPWYLGQGPLPDGALYTVTARATDVAGHQAQVAETVIADVVPPTPVTLTVSSDGDGVVTGATLREVSPTVTLEWTAAHDGSGLAGYLVDWTAAAISVTHHISRFAPYASRIAEFTAHEPQKLTVQLASEDAYGNESWQRFGPLYVDSPRTPDYVNLNDPDGIYRGWMESGCTLVGVDRRISRSALGREQKLYATWDEQALRLAWTGANWGASSSGSGRGGGDLFVYLDVDGTSPVPGGAITALNPYLATFTDTVIYLPAAMTADYLIWVWDSTTALLLAWDGSDWDLATTLSSSQYLFDPALNGGHTDLYIPFSLIGITDTVSATLDMVAFASEEEALRLWASMPSANPLNSERVVGMAAPAGETQVLTLPHRYHWDGLGAGVCLNGSDGSTLSRYVDTDVQVYIAVEPEEAGDGFLGDGQAFTYTVHYRNQGTLTATGVLVDVSAHAALRLPDGDLPDLVHQTVLLGDIGPSEEGSVTFPGVIDVQYCDGTLKLADCTRAVLEAALYDDAHLLSSPPLTRLRMEHRVDYSAPVFFGIQQPEYLVAAGSNLLYGYAYDDSGVPLVTLEVQDNGTLACPNDTPDDGQWSCVWDTTSANDGDILNVRLQATDGYGQVSAWSRWQPFLVDATPPAVTLSPTETNVISGSVVQGGAFDLVGDVFDDGGVAGVEVCVDDECGQADLWLGERPAPVSYDDVAVPPVAVGSAATCVTRTFLVTESFPIGQVSLGFNATHTRRDDLHVELQSPAGTNVLVLGDDGIPGTQFQHYDVLLNDATAGMYSGVSDDAPASPYYERRVRPYEPLRTFLGEDSAGVWTLRLCDLNPASDDGFYNRSRLILAPRQATAHSASWSHRPPDGGALDYVSRTLSIYGVDVVGNRAADPLRLDVVVDNVAPALAVTAVVTSITPTLTTRALSGTVSDGGAVSSVFVAVQTPAGKVFQEPATRTGAAWHYDLLTIFPGRYRLWVNASDLAENVATVGPFEVDVVIPNYPVFLPLVAKNWSDISSRILLPLVMKAWSGGTVAFPTSE